MTKQNAKNIDEQLKRDEDEYSGEGTVSGSSPDPESDDNTSDNLAQVIGNQPKQKFNIGDEINEDEEAATEEPINDYTAKTQFEKPESLDKKIGDEAVVPDPFDTFTDKDLHIKKKNGR